jgi:hypothetical protein
MNFHHCAKEKKGEGGEKTTLTQDSFCEKYLNWLIFQQKNALDIYYKVQQIVTI